MGKRGFVSSTASVSQVTFANVMKVNKTPGRSLVHIWFKIGVQVPKMSRFRCFFFFLNNQFCSYSRGLNVNVLVCVVLDKVSRFHSNQQ